MRRQSRVTFGPGAASLILIVVILSMSVLGILSLMSARNDNSLAERSAQVVVAGYTLFKDGEMTFSELDAICAQCIEQAAGDEDYLSRLSALLPSGMMLEGRVISWEETDGARTLDCAVELQPLDSQERLVWVRHSLSAVTEDVWN